MIGLISDTHEQKEEIKKAMDIFKSKNVDFVIHAGDIISPLTLKLFSGLKLKIVFGNNDGEKSGLNEMANLLGFEDINETKEFVYKKKKFFVYHGHVDSVLYDAIKDQEYDYIITGHTHIAKDEKIGNTRIINPGALFSSQKSIAVLDVENDKLIFKQW